jgi:hypothetical protein
MHAVARTSVFEGVEGVARALKAELPALYAKPFHKLSKAIGVVHKRQGAIQNQLHKRIRLVNAVERSLLSVVSARCDELRAQLKATAKEHKAALRESQRELGQGADLRPNLDRVRAMRSLAVEERPVEAVASLLQLKKDLVAFDNQVTHASASVPMVNIGLTIDTWDALDEGLRQFGWCGPMDIDPAQCTVNKHGDELLVQPGHTFEIIVTSRDQQGAQLRGGGLPFRVIVKPEGSVSGEPDVRDQWDGTYVISFKSGVAEDDAAAVDFSLRIEVCDSAIAGSPFAIRSSH